jgi:4-hydroxy-tetrahydrodipicolinate synthase
MKEEFTGIFSALITPFKDDAIDYQALELILNKQVAAKVSGVIVCGTTGESATLSMDEKLSLIDFVVKKVHHKIKVIAGTGCNDTKKSIKLSLEAQKLGVDALMVVTPYYNRPSQEGLYAHYQAINNHVDIPIFLYSVLKRTGIDFTEDTIVRLGALKNIVGIKDCTSDFTRILRLRQRITKEFYQLCGDDANILSYSANGGVGCISVASNIIPEKMVELFALIHTQQYKMAQLLQQKLLNFYDAIFCETNPVGVKYAASLLGMCKSDVRLPLVNLSAASAEIVKNALKNLS